MYLAHVPSVRPVRHVESVAGTMPLRGTAIGRAISGDVDADGDVATGPSVEHGGTTIAVPLHEVADTVVATISVAGRTFRTSGGDIGTIGERVPTRAGAPSRQLGCPGLPDTAV